MLWTFVGFNLILGVLLVHFMKKVIDKVKESYFVYPSEAVIDQTLPVEIMEHVMTFLDPLALIECRLVSKYWRHHAIKPQLEKSIVDAYDLQMKLTRLPDAGTKNLSYEPIWIEEDVFYPRQQVLRDRALAIKHGKQLLEINTSWVNQVLQAFRTDITLGDARKIDDLNKFIIKTFTHKGNRGKYCSINVGGDHIRFKEESVPGLDWDSLSNYGQLEVMFDLNDAFDSKKFETAQQKVYSVRELSPTKYFWFIPLNAGFVQVMATLFLPLIVHDVLQSEFLAIIKLWFGPIMFLLNMFVNVVMVLEFNHSRQMTPYYKRAAMIFWIGFVVLSWLAYPYVLTYYAVVGLVAGIFIYTVMLYEYTFHWNSKLTLRRAAPALIALVLVVTLNDWKYTVDSIRTGAILFRWFDNTVCFAVMCLNIVALNCFGPIASKNRWEWRYITDWERSVVVMLVKSYSIVLFITLYAPLWKGNHL